ncbi:MAG: hypothetical protein NT159_03200 [Proteobacteria bacterium]|nr:hypothetical protein [Pseudomonadota bacterium]
MTHPFIVWYSQLCGVTASLWVKAMSDVWRYPQQVRKQADR